MSDTDPYGQNISITTLTDAPDAEALARALAGLGSMVPQLVLRFASASARGAALTGVTAPEPGMATWLIAEKRLDIWDGAAWRPQVPDLITTNSGASAASGFDLINFEGWRDGRVCTINFSATRVGSTIEADIYGQIDDTPIGTLPSLWRPPDAIYPSAGDGFGHGEAIIASNGVISIRSWSNNPNSSNTNGGLVDGRNIRVTATFIRLS